MTTIFIPDALSYSIALFAREIMRALNFSEALQDIFQKTFRVGFYTNWIYKEYLFFAINACYNKVYITVVAIKHCCIYQLPLMDNAPPQKKIMDMQALIAQEEENYATAVKRNVGFNELKEKRLSIRTLKDQLQVLLSKEGMNDSNNLSAGSTESSSELTE